MTQTLARWLLAAALAVITGACYGCRESGGPEVVVYDETTGLIAEANAAALSLYGYRREDFIGLPVARLTYATRRSAAAPPRDSETGMRNDGGVIRRRDVT